MLKFFPISARARKLGGLLVSILLYILLLFIGGIVISLIGKLPLLGWLCGILGGALDLYAAIGVIVSILVFLKIVKK